MSTRTRIALVDDEEAVLDSLRLYLGVKGFEVRCFEQADELLEALTDGLAVECIVSDVRMPGLSGLDLQRELTVRRNRIPLILMTGYGDIEMAVSAIKSGVHDFIEKPFDEQRLVVVIEEALSQAQRRQADERDMEDLAARVAELTKRQREVMDLAVHGLTNKEIAVKLGIRWRTVESHRAWVMQRTGAKNLAELVRIAMLLERS